MEKKKLLLVTLGHFSCDINGGALPAALPYLRAAHNLDYQATGGLMLAYSCLASLIQPVFGFWADRHSKPWFIPLGILLAGCGITFLGLLGNYWLMCAAIAISGIGSAFFHPEGARFANRVSGKAKGTGMSFFSIGGNVGFILGPLIVSLFVSQFGLQGLSIFGITALFMAILVLWGVAHLPSSNQKKYNDIEKNRQSIGDNNWKEFSKLMLIIICRAMAFTGCNTFIPLYWVNYFNQPKSLAAFALVVFGLSGIIFNILGGMLSDRFGCVTLIRIAFFLMGPVILAFTLVEEVLYAWLLLPLLGLVLYLSFSSQVVLGQSLLARNMGVASGITLGVASTLGGLAQPCLGWIADGYGLGKVFICLGCIGLLGAIFSCFLKRERRNDI